MRAARAKGLGETQAALKGDEAIHVKTGEMIDAARQHVWIKAPEEPIERHSVGSRRAAKRGMRMLIVLFGSEAAVARYTAAAGSRAYLHEGSGAMIGPAREFITVATAFEETLTADVGEAAHGVFTKSSPVVYIAGSLIRHEVYVAEIFAHFGPQIEGAFGPALVKLRERYLEDEHVTALRNNL
ncbi:MAG TPA: hypothetical protein VED01_05340 [Burkholderiales bacterium]|nr:hypothetical protein [Burkholderiales bacterium]